MGQTETMFCNVMPCNAIQSKAMHKVELGFEAYHVHERRKTCAVMANVRKRNEEVKEPSVNFHDGC